MTSQRKHVIALQASAQRRTTYTMLTEIQALLSVQDIDMEIVNLHRLEIKDCLGCYHCLNKGGCVHKDDHEALVDKILAADGVIYATPVYILNMGATLKRYLDRAFVLAHQPRLAGKPFMSVVSTAGAGLKQVSAMLTKTADMMLMRPCGAITGKMRPDRASIKASDVAKFACLVNADRADDRPTIRQLFWFSLTKLLGSFTPVDAAFWQESGWLDRLWPYDCKLGINTIPAWFMAKVMVPIMARGFPSEVQEVL